MYTPTRRFSVHNTIIQYILLKPDYRIQLAQNTDGLVYRLASNLVILNQAHRVAWLIGHSLFIEKSMIDYIKIIL